MDSPAPNYLQRAVAEKKREKRWGEEEPLKANWFRGSSGIRFRRSFVSARGDFHSSSLSMDSFFCIDASNYIYVRRNFERESETEDRVFIIGEWTPGVT